MADLGRLVVDDVVGRGRLVDGTRRRHARWLVGIAGAATDQARYERGIELVASTIAMWTKMS